MGSPAARERTQQCWALVIESLIIEIMSLEQPQFSCDGCGLDFQEGTCSFGVEDGVEEWEGKR